VKPQKHRTGRFEVSESCLNVWIQQVMTKLLFVDVQGIDNGILAAKVAIQAEMRRLVKTSHEGF